MDSQKRWVLLGVWLLSGCSSAEPGPPFDAAFPGSHGCLAQAVATYDFVRLVRRKDGSVWKAVQGPRFERVGGSDFFANDIAASGSSAYSNAIGCAITGGAVWCFSLAGPLGSASDLGAGDAGDATSDQPQPVLPRNIGSPVVQLQGATQLSGGQNGGGASFCAVLRGQAWCWGFSVNGLLGSHLPEHSSTAWPVVDLHGVVEVRVGYDASCARLDDGSVWCWGDNTYGELGSAVQGTTQPVLGMATPTRVELGQKALRLAASPGTTHCAILADHTAVCWGRNHWGQAGAPENQPIAPPTLVRLSEGGSALTGVLDIAPDRGMEATCATTSSGGLWCWGHAFAAGPERAATGPYAARAYVDDPAFEVITAPLVSYGATDGKLVFIDGQGRLVFGAGNMPAELQPSCD